MSKEQKFKAWWKKQELGRFNYDELTHFMLKRAFYAGMQAEKNVVQIIAGSDLCKRIMHAADKSRGVELSVYEVYELAGHTQVQDESK